MSADGYFRVPRRLATAAISPERVAALLWISSQASYAVREVDGVTLDVGETPPIAASEFERRYKWTRKAARVFLDYALSDRCAEETGIRIRIGKKGKGPPQGPSVGPSQGPTYVVRLQRVEMCEGPALGPSKGPPQGPSVKKKVVEEGNNTPPTGESRGGDSKNGTAPRKRAVPIPLPDDWQPNDAHRLACIGSGIDCDALADDFRFYWRSINGTKANWDMTFSKRIAAVRSTGKFRMNGNGKGHFQPTGVTAAPDEAVADSIIARMFG